MEIPDSDEDENENCQKADETSDAGANLSTDGVSQTSENEMETAKIKWKNEISSRVFHKDKNLHDGLNVKK